MRRISRIELAALLSLTSFATYADDSQKYKELLSMSLGEMLQVEVATGTAKQLSEAPAIVSVITADDIAAVGARTLSEALEQVPGLHVASSLNRLTPMFSIRGIFTDSTPQVLVLIDGVEISELTALSVPYAFRYPTNFIERIEIIRGPGSAVYGADAFSGVINVITKRPDGNAVQAGVRLGSFDYLETWVNASYSINDLKLALSVTRDEEGNDNDRITPYGVMQRDRELYNLHLNLEYGDFSLKNWFWRTDQQMGVGAGIIGNDFDRDISEVWRTQLSWQGTLTEKLDGAFDVSYGKTSFDARFQLFPPGTWPVGDDGNIFLPPFTPVDFPEGVIGLPLGATQKARFNGAVVYSEIENHRIRVGFGLEDSELTDVEESKNFGPGILDSANLPSDGISDAVVDVTGTPFIYSPEYQRDLWYVSVQDEWKITPNMELTSGIRFDQYSDFGSTANPRLALVWTTTPTLTSKLLFATAFRAPKVAELAFINNPTTLGNPDLQPEEIQTFELAFDYRPSGQFNGKLNVFSYQSQDLIQLNQAFTYENVGEQDGVGFEVEADWQLNDSLRLRGNISWLDSELPVSDEDKERVPGMMSFVDVRYQVTEQITLTTQSYWISDRKREAGDARPEVDDYLQTDLNLLWQFTAASQIALGVKNLFNENIVEPVPDSALFALGLGFPDDYPMQSRSVFGSILYMF